MIIKFHNEHGRFYFESPQEFTSFVNNSHYYEEEDFRDASEQEMIQFMKDSKEM